MIFLLIIVGALIFFFLRDQLQKYEIRQLNRQVFGDITPEELAVPRHKEKMNLNEFWALIDRSRQDSTSTESQAKKLKVELENLQPKSIIEFDNRFRDLKNKLYRWDLWGALYLFNGGCSDDSFDYFRSWLAGQGREKFDRVVKDPEEIIDFVKACFHMFLHIKGFLL